MVVEGELGKQLVFDCDSHVVADFNSSGACYS